jgi:hypothetical protein
VRREKGRSNTTTITALTDGIMKSLDNFLRRGSNPQHSLRLPFSTPHPNQSAIYS